MLDIIQGKLYRIDGERIADKWYLTSGSRNNDLCGIIYRNSIFLLLDTFEDPFSIRLKILTGDGSIGWTYVRRSCIHEAI
jgi:hypothetical protein